MTVEIPDNTNRELQCLDAALSLHLLTEQDYLAAKDYWEISGGKMSELLQKMGFVTEGQSKTLDLLISEDTVFRHANFSSIKPSHSKGDDVDETESLEKDSLFESLSDITTKENFSKFQPIVPEELAPENAPHTLQTDDELFGQYSYIDHIGSGGLGQVMRCCDRSFDRDLALKEIRYDLKQHNTKLIIRFLREARVTGQLQHPGIVPVYEMGIKPNGSLYYTMKYVQGKPLDKVLNAIEKSDATPEAKYKDRLRYLPNLISVCRAMGYAHDKGVIHRDLKPANIILGKHGETIILDWGLAKVLNTPDVLPDNAPESMDDTQILTLQSTSTDKSSSKKLDITMEGEMIGTPAFMAPEQVDSSYGTVDIQSDVYALGIILYRILMGKSPYQSSTLKELLHEIADPYKQITKLNLGKIEIPADLAAICVKCLSKKKEERFASANELADELSAFQGGRLVSIYTYSLREYLRRFVRRNKLATSFMLLALATLIIGLAVSLFFGRQASVERSIAVTEAKRAGQAEQTAIMEQKKVIAANKVTQKTVTMLPKFSDRVLNRTQQISKQVENHLIRLRDELNTATLWQEWDNGLLNEKALTVKIADMMKKNSEWLSIVITDESGIVRSIMPLSMQSSIGVNLKTQHHIYEAINQKRPVCSRLYENAEKNFIGMSMVMPVLRNDKVIGLICGVFNPQEVLGRLINEETMGTTLMGMCIDQVGYVLLDESFPHKTFQNLFADPFYEKNTDFHSTCLKIFTQPFGIGHYLWNTGDKGLLIHRIIAWNIVDMSNINLGEEEKWAIVLTGSFYNGEDELMTREKWKALQEKVSEGKQETVH